ncbi:MAG: hypothetical protein UHU21_13520, partial [Lachnospiraceae bacterium]|nr:hypothetical protein [Lachnospiraceae bacterium]
LTGIGSLIFSILTKLKKSNSRVLIFPQNIQQIFIPVFVQVLIARVSARRNACVSARRMPPGVCVRKTRAVITKKRPVTRHRARPAGGS